MSQRTKWSQYYLVSDVPIIQNILIEVDAFILSLTLILILSHDCSAAGKYVYLVPYRNSYSPENGQRGFGLLPKIDLNIFDIGGVDTVDMASTARPQIPSFADIDLRGFSGGFACKYFVCYAISPPRVRRKRTCDSIQLFIVACGLASVLLWRSIFSHRYFSVESTSSWQTEQPTPTKD